MNEEVGLANGGITPAASDTNATMIYCCTVSRSFPVLS